MVYDALNRLTNKNYPGDSRMTNVVYTYNSTSGGNYGKGKRTGIKKTLRRPKPAKDRVSFTPPLLVTAELWQRANQNLRERGRAGASRVELSWRSSAAVCIVLDAVSPWP